MYQYCMYGLSILSDILLFNIPQTTSDHTDVSIHSGYISYEGIPASQKYFFLNDRIAIYECFCGRIQIISGQELIYSINEGFSQESITPFIVGWGIAFILTQRKHSAFHCSALKYNNHSFFVSGASGSGKSTTALQLIKKGCKYLADDIAIINSIEDMMILPAFPVQKICPDIAQSLIKDRLYAIHNDRGKYAYLNQDDFCFAPQQLSVIFKLTLNDSDTLRISEESGVAKFFRVLECLFLIGYYSDYGIPDEEKFRCLKIAEKIRVFTISRPKGINTIDSISDSIIEVLNTLED